MKYLVYIALFVALALGGCGKKDESKAKKSPSPTEQPAKPATPTEPVKPDPPKADELATQPDFEESASKEITSDNLEEELEKIEGDLGE